MSEQADEVVVLVTREQYNKMSPVQQGYFHYAQAELPGSELKGLCNPYQEGTAEYVAWQDGQIIASHDVADMDDDG